MSNYHRELRFMRRAANEASRLSERCARNGLKIHDKADHSQVTDADLACETAIRQRLGNAFPGYGMLGEEEAETGATEGFNRRFVIDPIDGTSNFVRGIPSFGPIIALEVNGEIVAGAFNITPLRLHFWAEKGEGAFLNGKRTFVSSVKRVKDAAMSFGNPSRMFHDHAEKPWIRMVRAVKHVRGFGDLLSYGLVAAGRADIAIEAYPKPWDLAEPKIVIEEAGGTFTVNGKRSIYGKPGDWVVATNGKLHREALKVLGRKK